MHEEQEKPETLFVAGMRWFKPHENAPSFVKGKISIEPNKLVEFLKANKRFMDDKGYLSVNVKKSAKGEIYLSLDTYKKAVPKDTFEYPKDEIDPNDVPF